MESWEHIHWFITSRCNLECDYCFKPDEDYGHSFERIKALAQLLVNNGVKKVTLGGGEPTIVKSLDQVLRILKDGGIELSIHTNGVLLAPDKIGALRGLVDDIALPLDSIERQVQMRLRGKAFMPVFDNIARIIENIHKEKIRLGYHTVFTKINGQEMPELYRFIKKEGFDYWRIYQFNYELARQTVLKKKAADEKEQAMIVKRYKSMEELVGEGHPEKGYTDTLFADFLLMEEKMTRHHDNRVQFVGIRDEHKPTYAFLDNSGDISFYTSFSGSERRVLGNLLKDNTFIMKKLGNIHRKIAEDPIFFDEHAQDEWLEAKGDSEVWTRLDEGAYSYNDEIEVIKSKYMPLFNKLAKLYLARNERIAEHE